MNLGAYLPPQSGEASSVFSLLNVLSNPEEAKKVLQKMVDDAKRLDESLVKQMEATAANEKAAKRSEDALATLHTAKSELERQRAELVVIDTQTHQRATAMAAREDAANTRDRELQDKEHKLVAREGAADAREKQLEQRESLLGLREHKLAEDIAENAKWLASLKPPRAR